MKKLSQTHLIYPREVHALAIRLDIKRTFCEISIALDLERQTTDEKRRLVAVNEQPQPVD